MDARCPWVFRRGGYEKWEIAVWPGGSALSVGSGSGLWWFGEEGDASWPPQLPCHKRHMLLHMERCSGRHCSMHGERHPERPGLLG